MQNKGSLNLKFSMILFLALLLIFVTIPAYADTGSEVLSVQDMNMGVSPQSMVNTLMDGKVDISNVQYTGDPAAAGFVQGGTSIFGFDKGIVLSSGRAASIVGPNNSGNYTDALNQPGDPTLDELAKSTTHDASTLEFDFFVPADATNNTVDFQYIFGSEEYNEYTNSNYNDVFGFILNGQNVALVPGTNVPVSINTINGGNPLGTGAVNPEFFINNENPATYNTQMDGFTKVLTVSAPVKKGQMNHIKLSIADVSDSVFNSWVVIRAGSFNVTTDVKVSATVVNFKGNADKKMVLATVKSPNGFGLTVDENKVFLNGTYTPITYDEYNALLLELKGSAGLALSTFTSKGTCISNQGKMAFLIDTDKDGKNELIQMFLIPNIHELTSGNQLNVNISGVEGEKNFSGKTTATIH